ncbi:hypothetical protein BDP81DRAFT_66647 [Colletotrichum phormii]|uniref:Uncharacterized protein n=1 Tax=Colletotrichum phormii TaxID=359342 RepID=A0AAJ0EEK4_9PEZI|nr:uncharacterized protein BDP81DRAFT_66647 [Colletotrichum phormii]KAK1634181.1 hypothetical protein BDP81DRAFT_66647 [Colletotrichum phormii]
MKQSCSIGHSISERRPIGLTLEQSTSVATHPTIRELTKPLRELPQGSGENSNRESETSGLTSKPQTTSSVRYMASDLPTLRTDDTCRPQGPAPRHLMKKLTAPIVTTLEGQYRRRDEAIEAVSTYCLVQEGCTVPRSRPRSTPEAAICCSTSDPPEGGQLDLVTRSVLITNDKERPKRCFICIGQASDLIPDDKGRLDELTHEFCSRRAPVMFSASLQLFKRSASLKRWAIGDRGDP